MRLCNELLFNTASAGATANSSPVDISSVFALSLQAVFAGGGSPVGVLKLQVSNDPASAVPANWSDLASGSVAVPDDGVVQVGKLEVCHQWLRAVYTRTSGTGTMSVRVKTNGF